MRKTKKIIALVLSLVLAVGTVFSIVEVTKNKAAAALVDLPDGFDSFNSNLFTGYYEKKSGNVGVGGITCVIDCDYSDYGWIFAGHLSLNGIIKLNNATKDERFINAKFYLGIGVESEWTYVNAKTSAGTKIYAKAKIIKKSDKLFAVVVIQSFNNGKPITISCSYNRKDNNDYPHSSFTSFHNQAYSKPGTGTGSGYIFATGYRLNRKYGKELMHYITVTGTIKMDNVSKDILSFKVRVPDLKSEETSDWIKIGKLSNGSDVKMRIKYHNYSNFIVVIQAFNNGNGVKL